MRDRLSKGGTVGIREKITKALLHKIEVNMDTLALEDSVNVFSEFIRAVALEADLLNSDVENDGSAEQKEVDEILTKMAKKTLWGVNTSTKGLMIDRCISAKIGALVKGQEIRIYAGNKPSLLDERPKGVLLCKAIFGESVRIINSGKASYGLLLKNNQYVGCVDVGTVPGPKTLCVSDTFLRKDDYFTIYNWG